MIPHLWAPLASSVRLWLETGERPMTAGRDGWWEADVELSPDTRYGFLLDEETTPLPDPRGQRLPDGVHGTSAVVSVDPYAWTDAEWPGRELPGSVIYEMHIGTFTPDGTLDSAIERLDYLVELGVDLVEVLPVNAFNGTHNWGYDGVAWYAVQETYGGPPAYQRFVDACHARGLGVIQDVVYNHLGPSGNYLPKFGPYLRDGEGNTWGDSVNLDETEVRRYILDNARMWLEEYHVDGLRLDAVHALVDRSPRHILAEMAEETDALATTLGRPLTLIAESDLNDPVMITPPEAGYGLAAQWSDDYHHAVHVALSGETTGYYADFAAPDALTKVWAHGFYHDGTYSSFRERNHGKPIPADVPTSRLVTFSQDHDQIGNRATGDRLSQSLSPDRLAVGAVLTVLSPYTPMLFMGEEWGASTPWQFFSSHPEPDLGRATAEGRIAEFEKMGWDPDVVPDPQDPATFTRSKLDWAETEQDPHARILAVYRALTALRRSEPDLHDTSFAALSAEGDSELGQWSLRRGSIVISVNLGTDPWALGEVGEVLFATEDGLIADGVATLTADSAIVTRSV